MKKEFGKSVAGVILFMVITVVMAAAGNLLQFSARKELGTDTSYFFASTAYRYNMVSYLLGHVIFVGFLVMAFLFFWKKRIAGKQFMKGGETAIYIVANVFFSLMMVVILYAEDVCMLGLTGHMRPKGLLDITLLSWPLITIAYMIVVTVLLKKRADKAAKESAEVCVNPDGSIVSNGEVLVASDEWPEDTIQ